ncbi:MAG: hypothetical protein ACE5K4_02180 [Candidatus Hydrothermarchaeota archaeon]
MMEEALGEDIGEIEEEIEVKEVDEVKLELRDISSSPEKITVGAKDVRLNVRILNSGTKTAELLEITIKSDVMKPSITDSHRAFIDEIKPKGSETAKFRVDITTREDGVVPVDFEIKYVEDETEKKIIRTREIPIMPKKKKSKVLTLITALIIIAVLLSISLGANYYFDFYPPVNQQLSQIIQKIPLEKIPIR